MRIKNTSVKIFIGIILILSTIQLRAQNSLKKELDQIFYSLPLHYEIEELIDSANNSKDLELRESSDHDIDLAFNISFIYIQK